MRLARVWACLLVFWTAAAHAQWDELRFVDPRLSWRTVESEHFSAHFAEGYRDEARLALAVAESVYPRVTAALDWEPRSRTHLVILDSADFSNGEASALPFNFASIFLTPPDAGELLQNRDWLELVLTHELFHVVHLDKARGGPLSLRTIFGRLPFLFPNTLQPSWIVEGLAVDAESDPARGYGRLGQSTFEGMMHAEAARGLRSLAEVNAEGRGFPLNRDYLYGSYFFAFLRERYGADAVRAFVENYSVNLIPFRVESNPKAITGKPMDALWLDYQAWLRNKFSGQPGTPISEGEPLLSAFSIQSPALSADGTRWYVQGDGYTRPRLVRQGPGEAPKRLRETEDDTRLAPAGDGVLMSELEICRNYNLLYRLYRVDARGARQPLSECQRERLAAPLADGRIAVVRATAGANDVLMLDGQGRELRSLYRTAPGESLSGLAAYADSIVLTSLRDARWSVIKLKDGQASVLVSDAAIKYSPRFDEHGELFFVANYGGRYDVWSLGPQGGLLRWTRSANGVREMSAPVGGEMLLVTIEADGDALRSYRLPAEPLERRQIVNASPSGAPAAAKPIEGTERAYSPWRSLRPTSWLPLIDLSEGAVALGALVYGQDALGVHEYYLAPMVELTQGELLGYGEYVYDGRHGVMVNRTLTVRATEGSNSDPKIRAYSIKEDAQWLSTWRRLALNRRFYWGLGAALEEETFHDLALGTTSEPQNERVVGLVAGVDTRRAQWLSEGPSEGQQLRLFAETSKGLGATFTGSVLRADWRSHLALGRTVLSVRWNEAGGEVDAERFSLGGSKSDDVTILPVLNQREFALRGYTNGALTGHRMRVISTEWRIPVRDVDRHLMVPPVGINRVSLVPFLDVGAAWEHGAAPDYHRGAGLELLAEPRLGYLFAWQARAGVAKGLDAPGETKAYLELGRAF